jgi:hypothetical protein
MEGGNSSTEKRFQKQKKKVIAKPETTGTKR